MKQDGRVAQACDRRVGVAEPRGATWKSGASAACPESPWAFGPPKQHETPGLVSYLKIKDVLLDFRQSEVERAA
jgi:hypothetical protein